MTCIYYDDLIVYIMQIDKAQIKISILYALLHLIELVCSDSYHTICPIAVILHGVYMI